MRLQRWPNPAGNEMPIIHIDSLDDPRVACFRNAKDRALDREGRRFIAEGTHLVRRLLASSFATEALLLTPRRAEELQPLVPEHVPVYVVSSEQMNLIVGMKFHSGALACGIRKARQSIEDVIPKNKDRLTLVICPETSNVENIGSIIRISAGFGVDAIVLGEKSHDPFWRQSVRVSMGTVFTLPIYQSLDLKSDLLRLKNEWNIQLMATVLSENAKPLNQMKRPANLGLLFGNEAQGLDSEWIDVCNEQVIIPMQLGTDSLNVATSVGIFLYHFMQERNFT